MITIIFKLIVSLILLILFAEFLKRIDAFIRGKGFFRKKRFISPWFTTYEAPPPEEKNEMLYFKRGKVVSRVVPENTIRIICLGDSTTINYGTKLHYPTLLESKLNEHYKNLNFEVLNAGGDAYSTAHTLVNLALRLIYLKPDCIIVYQNINDITANYFSPPLKTDYANKYLNNLFLAPEYKIGIQRYLIPSRLLTLLMMKLNNKVFEHNAIKLRDKIDLSVGKEVFRTNLNNIITIAQENRIKVILATQAACFEKRSSRFAFIKRDDFCAYNSIIKQLAEEKKVIVADCFASFKEEAKYFSDTVHYTEEGIEKLSSVFFELFSEIYQDKKIN